MSRPIAAHVTAPSSSSASASPAPPPPPPPPPPSPPPPPPAAPVRSQAGLSTSKRPACLSPSADCVAGSSAKRVARPLRQTTMRLYMQRCDEKDEAGNCSDVEVVDAPVRVRPPPAPSTATCHAYPSSSAPGSSSSSSSSSPSSSPSPTVASGSGAPTRDYVEVSSDDDEEKEEEKQTMETPAPTRPLSFLHHPHQPASPSCSTSSSSPGPSSSPPALTICCRRPRTALGARPSRGQVRPGEERASADVQMSCPGLLEERGSTGTSSAPSPDTSGAYEGTKAQREAPHQPRAQQRQALPLHLAWLPPGPFATEAATSPHTYSPTFTRETSPTSARPTSPSARRRTRPSMRCWTTSPSGTTVSRGGSARMPSVGSGSTAAVTGRCMCRRRTRGRRGRVRSSGVMC